ncbi:MAG: DNA polymerase III subunit gamma/tau [Ruminococcaceae bacterium]|nr:DNA polymerase III subunit gamma/tau [Oscillospiraceae bacterium]
MYQALYRKWRPKTFSDVVGQEHITSTLRRQVAEGRLSHAYLFTGTRGTGKTTCAKILAKAVNCENPQDGDPCNACPACMGIESGAFLDVTEMDAASNNGVDSVRALRDEAVYAPAQVKKRVYIIDEVHMLSPSAFNALLKILEEPPEHLMFILATTELHKVLPTILSRCQRFAFRRILPRDIEARLAYVAEQEGIDLKPDGAELLARLSDGALRDALSLLDQCAATGGSIGAQEVLDVLGLAGNVQTAQLLGFILRRDAKAALLLLHRLYTGGKDVGAVLGELSTLARDLLISATAPEGGAALLSGGYDEKTLSALRRESTAARLVQICTVLQECAAGLQLSVNRRTDAELCLLRLCDESLSGDLTAINARIARIEDQLAAGAAYRAQNPQSAAAERSAPAVSAPEPAVQPEPAPEAAEDAPPWGEEAPPPYGEPIAPEPKAEPQPEPAPKSAPATAPTEAPEPEAKAEPERAAESAPQPQSASAADDGTVFLKLMETYKNRLPMFARGFISAAKGRLADGVLTVYCGSDGQKGMLDKPEVASVLAEVTSQAVGENVTVRFDPGDPPGEKHDPMQDLLQMGGRFDGFKVR